MRFRSLVLATAGVASLGAQARPTPITPENAARLAPAWTYDTRESMEPVPPARKKPASRVTAAPADASTAATPEPR